MEGYVYIGIITKPHSYKGKIQVFVENEKIKLTPQVPVFVEFQKVPVPFFIEESTAKTGNISIVKFKDIDNEADAQNLRNRKLYFLKETYDGFFQENDSFDINIIRDFDVIDTKYGLIGLIRDILKYPGHDVMQIFDDRKNEILIPFNESYVLEINKKTKKVHVNTPPGLLDIYKIN
ncbi:MAG: ribosome maturation factor RimM [Bacteroidales bacterium]|nr:ribosome maturation factor RimM [Bacteroidales bacterium]